MYYTPIKGQVQGVYVWETTGARYSELINRRGFISDGAGEIYGLVRVFFITWESVNIPIF